MVMIVKCFYHAFQNLNPQALDTKLVIFCLLLGRGNLPENNFQNRTFDNRQKQMSLKSFKKLLDKQIKKFFLHLKRTPKKKKKEKEERKKNKC